MLGGIEKEDASSSAPTDATNKTAVKHSSASSTISIKELLSLVNEDAAKYIPANDTDYSSGDSDVRYSVEDEGEQLSEYSQMQKETPQDRPFPEEYNEYAAVLNEVLDSYKQKLPRKQKERKKSALAALEESLESHKASKKYFGYLLLQDNEDYAEKSRYKSTANGKTRNWIDILLDDYSETGFDDPLYDAINGNEDARQVLRDQAGARYGSGTGAPEQLRGISAEDAQQAKMMMEEEIGLFNYLYATQGKETAYDFYYFLRDDLSSRLRQEKGENDSSDQKQFEEYKKILGENMPNTLADFQDLKYNKPEKWKLYRLDKIRKTLLINHPELALPGDRKVISDSKFTRYIFNKDNPHGWVKGVNFERVLGYSSKNWQKLQAEIMYAQQQNPAKVKRETEFGIVYEQQMILYGETGNPTNVLVGWIHKPDGITSMTTAYIKKVKF